MKLTSTLIAVKDKQRSIAFYQKWFGLDVLIDLGWNVALTGGLSLQEHFDRLVGFPEDSLIEKPHNMELYFETDELDDLNARMLEDPTVEWVHPVKEYPWHQRVLRVYDPDYHMIEVGDSMASVFRRLADEGNTAEQVAEMTQHPAEYVRAVLAGEIEG